MANGYKEMVEEIDGVFDPETDIIEITTHKDPANLKLYTTNMSVAIDNDINFIESVLDLEPIIASWTLLDIEDIRY